MSSNFIWKSSRLGVPRKVKRAKVVGEGLVVTLTLRVEVAVQSLELLQLEEGPEALCPELLQEAYPVG